jgi:lanosterol synthase
MVYLPMGYLYGTRYQAPEDELILSLREELYPKPYESIHWPSQQGNVASVDEFCPSSAILNFLNGALNYYESMPNSLIRKRALDMCLEQLRAEDENTDFLDLGPVNKVMNMLIAWIVDGPESESFRRHVVRIPDFLWMSSEGMMMNGTNGSQLWDTAFATQAFIESGLAQEPEFHGMMVKCLSFLEDMQIPDNMPNHKQCYRHQSKGAWPFSTRDQSYTVSDCTAEGLKSVLLLQNKLEYFI